MRWSSGETRFAVGYFELDDGTPAAGLAPTAIVRRVSTGALQLEHLVAEIGDGFYRVSVTAPDDDGYVVLLDAGDVVGMTARRIAMEIPSGGYVDNMDAPITSRTAAAVWTNAKAALLDVTVSGRASQATVDALTAAVAVVDDLVDDLETSLGTKASQASVDAVAAGVATLLARLTEVRAAALDLLNAAIDSRASAAQVAALQLLVDDLETQITAVQAALDPGLADRIARRSDVEVTVAAPITGEVGP